MFYTTLHIAKINAFSIEKLIISIEKLTSSIKSRFLLHKSLSIWINRR